MPRTNRHMTPNVCKRTHTGGYTLILRELCVHTCALIYAQAHNNGTKLRKKYDICKYS